MISAYARLPGVSRTGWMVAVARRSRVRHSTGRAAEVDPDEFAPDRFAGEPVPAHAVSESRVPSGPMLPTGSVLSVGMVNEGPTDGDPRSSSPRPRRHMTRITG
ncbi:hypothetical protein GCM10010172_02670 [Paractinoplanes ferrugineus]|uniref:Uncharacterized protein n=1 Tax=Paractinoplanes ferrugineus TaxID=113564 RepID=A0A919J5E3_9ACTN|nr:hypothetical protein Afe05nite_55120 [Actinoplanes ferrugineus]